MPPECWCWGGHEERWMPYEAPVSMARYMRALRVRVRQRRERDALALEAQSVLVWADDARTPAAVYCQQLVPIVRGQVLETHPGDRVLVRACDAGLLGLRRSTFVPYASESAVLVGTMAVRHPEQLRQKHRGVMDRRQGAMRHVACYWDGGHPPRATLFDLFADMSPLVDTQRAPLGLESITQLMLHELLLGHGVFLVLLVADQMSVGLVFVQDKTKTGLLLCVEQASLATVWTTRVEQEIRLVPSRPGPGRPSVLRIVARDLEAPGAGAGAGADAETILDVQEHASGAIELRVLSGKTRLFERCSRPTPAPWGRRLFWSGICTRILVLRSAQDAILEPGLDVVGVWRA